MATRDEIAEALMNELISLQHALSNELISLEQALQGTLNRQILIDLPEELRMKILASLPGTDIARVSCVSTEIRNLASDNDLWKQKCVEDFEDRVTEEELEADEFVVDWKDKFGCLWRQLKAKKQRTVRVSCNPKFGDSWFGVGDRDRGSSALRALNNLL